MIALGKFAPKNNRKQTFQNIAAGVNALSETLKDLGIRKHYFATKGVILSNAFCAVTEVHRMRPLFNIRVAQSDAAPEEDVNFFLPPKLWQDFPEFIAEKDISKKVVEFIVENCLTDQERETYGRRMFENRVREMFLREPVSGYRPGGKSYPAPAHK